DKSFTLQLTSPTGATIDDATGSGTISANHLLAGCPVSPTANQRFVCHLYFDALGRAAESGGFTFWVNLLNTGTKRSTMAKSYLGQPESLNRVADRTYVLYLARHGTTLEQTGWAAKYKAKTAKPEDTRVAVLSSAEYFTKVGATNTAFVQHIFQDVFRRPVDDSGLTYWTGQLTSGKTRAQVAKSFLDTAEGRTKVIGDVYLRFLRRIPGTSEAQFWVDQFKAGKSEIDIGISIVGSTEYFNRP
ncbi:MAG TPA: DUF4214 domain-containing protein, partial [Acidimicrobiales bacterium]